MPIDLFRLERIKAAQKYFNVELLDKDCIFVPINRRYIQHNICTQFQYHQNMLNLKVERTVFWSDEALKSLFPILVFTGFLLLYHHGK